MRVIVILPPSVTASPEGRDRLNGIQAYIRGENFGMRIEFEDSVWQDIPVSGARAFSQQMSEMIRRQSNADKVIYTEDAQNDTQCSMLLNVAREDGIDVMTLPKFRLT